MITFWRWLGIVTICAALVLSLPTSPISDIWYDDQVAVIAYHHIDAHDKSGVTITPQLFESQLRDLKSRGYHFITMQQFERFFSGGKVPPNSVLVTFDDGYQSFYTNAYPILRKLAIPATNFVITKDLEDPLHSNIPSLSRDQIREMLGVNKGYQFGCHSEALHTTTPAGTPLLTSKLTVNGQQETNQQFRARIEQDTRTCMAKLTDLESDASDTYAYPFGYYDATTIQMLKEVGIHYAFTTQSKLVTRGTSPYEIPRLNAGSPYVRAVSLNNLILRKIADSIPASDLLPLGDAIRQLGGTAHSGDNGGIVIQFDHAEYRILPDRRTVLKGADSYFLSHPLVMKHKNNFIREDDLERLLSISITYNPVKEQYLGSARQTK